MCSVLITFPLFFSFSKSRSDLKKCVASSHFSGSSFYIIVLRRTRNPLTRPSFKSIIWKIRIKQKTKLLQNFYTFGTITNRIDEIFAILYDFLQNSRNRRRLRIKTTTVTFMKYMLEGSYLLRASVVLENRGHRSHSMVGRDLNLTTLRKRQ